MVRTRSALRRALLSLLERKQFDQIRIRDIATEAQIGYATFFRHHPSKAELLKDVAEEQISKLLDLAKPLLVASDTQGSCLALCEYVDDHRALWTALLTGGAAGAVREEFLRQTMIKGPVDMPPVTRVPVELGAVFGVASTVEILAWWLRRPNQLSVHEIAEVIDHLVVSPIVNWKRNNA
ncbi:MAG TPA: TetR/AcrR family transcriptional regulator [Steroidobacteraceae bacterium]|jgi:AcrR family transcriptional regulator|nr:TetR/AcrR family transcriptional regulator [Steroidobacteraceae bacterium]